MRRIALAILLVQILSAQGWVTFYSAYEDGLSAQKRGDHAYAIRAFSQAIALQSRPGNHIKTYGLNFLATYHPYLRLAESRMVLQDLAGAEAALTQSQALGLEPAPEREALWVRLRRLKPQPTVPLAAPVLPATLPEAPKAAVVPPEILTTPAPAVATSEAVPEETPAKPAPIKPGPSLAKVPPVTASAANPEPRVSAPASRPASFPSQPPAPVRALWLWWVLGGLLTLLGATLLLRRFRSARRGSASSCPRLGAELKDLLTPEPPEPLKDDVNVGRHFGAYVAQHRLSAGGCATAYYGVHASSGLEVAIKVPHPHLLANPDFRNRFHREAALGRLLDHPRIARTLEIAAERASPWIVLEFIHGITLQALMAREGPMPIPRSLILASDLAEALAHAHAKGVVHRDLKPSNVMVTSEGAVVLDFGIARILDASMTQTSQFMGTPAYAAPEALNSAKAGPAADRYALGMILFEMLAGQRAYAGVEGFELLEAHRYRPLPDLLALRPDLPAKLWRLIERLASKAPEGRPEDGETLNILDSLRREYPL